MPMHRNHWGIFVTHAYVNWNDRLYDWRFQGSAENPQDHNPHGYGTLQVNDGQEIWDKLIKHHHFVMVFSGHVLGDGTGHVPDKTDAGNTCHQMLSNYQVLNGDTERYMGGEGYMRLLDFATDGRTVRVFTYSPFRNEYRWDRDEHFSFTLD